MKKLFVGLTLLLVVGAANAAVKVPGPLVDTRWLAANLGKVVVLDIRVDKHSFTTNPVIKIDKKTRKKSIVKLGGHIPGAILIDGKKIRTKKMVGGIELEKMLPGKAAMEAMIQAHGVNQDSAIVIVSDGKSGLDMTGATRLYWQLKYYGQDNMAVLDGGMAQWLMDGRKISLAKSAPAKGNWKATAERNDILATSEDVEAAMKSGKVQLVDNRPLNQYLGATYKKSYVYAPGHIPGAKPFPTELVTTAGEPAKFNNTKQLMDLSKAMGVDPNKPSIAYCNSGHLATGGWFYMHEIMGNKNVKMYDGSMHEWTKEKRPTVTMKME